MANPFDKLSSSNGTSSAPTSNASSEPKQSSNKLGFKSNSSSASNSSSTQSGTKSTSKPSVGFKSSADSLAQKQATYNDKNTKVYNSKTHRYEYWSQSDIDEYDKTHGERQWASEEDIALADRNDIDDKEQIEYSKELERKRAEAQKKRQSEKEAEAQKKIAYDPNGNTYSMDDNGITVTDPNSGATNTYPTGTPEYNSAVTQYFPNQEQPTQSAYSEEDPATVPTANDMTSYNAQTAANGYQERGKTLTDRVRQAEEEAPLFPSGESVDEYAPKTVAGNDTESAETNTVNASNRPMTGNSMQVRDEAQRSDTGDTNIFRQDLYGQEEDYTDDNGGTQSATTTTSSTADLSNNGTDETTEDLTSVEEISNALSQGYTIKDSLERQQLEDVIDDAFYAGQLDYSQYLEYMQSIADSYRRTEQEQQRVRSVGGY